VDEQCFDNTNGVLEALGRTGESGGSLENAVEADSLVKVFGGSVKALDGLSLGVEAGTIFGLLGPNGAGKTTAVRILTTIIPPDQGRATVLGRDVVKSSYEVRANIGLAGQYAAVDENLTGKENLRLIGQLSHLRRREASRRADELLEQFELSDAAGRTAKTYSGGMRRRLDLAAALVDRPPVLFLDEPTTGLDPASRTSLWAMIERLVEAGTTVVLTTQYLEEADRLASRVAVVDHGRVIAEGTPAQLKAGMGVTVLDLMMGDRPQAERAAGVLSSVSDKQPSLRDTTVEVPVGDGYRPVMSALQALDEAGLSPSTLALREPSLDDVFLALTGHAAEERDGAGGPD
jgi:ABC-2 type transport system ATP-binding protein